MSSQYKLYEEFAHRYDLHTPVQHYRHDHEFVLDELRTAKSCGKRILDVGCGTGTFLAKALAAGFDGHGIEPAEGMAAIAAGKVGSARSQKISMEELQSSAYFDGITALSWVINYAADWASVSDILTRMHRALLKGGKLILQCAHAPNMNSIVLEDRETGPTGEEDDIVLLFQFNATKEDRATARYIYACKTQKELMFEEHALAVADANRLASIAAEVGFQNIRLQGNWAGSAIESSSSVWLIGERL